MDKENFIRDLFCFFKCFMLYSKNEELHVHMICSNNRVREEVAFKENCHLIIVFVPLSVSFLVCTTITPCQYDINNGIFHFVGRQTTYQRCYLVSMKKERT